MNNHFQIMGYVQSMSADDEQNIIMTIDHDGQLCSLFFRAETSTRFTHISQGDFIQASGFIRTHCVELGGLCQHIARLVVVNCDLLCDRLVA